MHERQPSRKKMRIGPTMEKVLLLLKGGAMLALTAHPAQQFKVIKGIAKEWQKINQRALRDAIRKLYQSKLISYTENNDGTVSLVLTEEGGQKILRYDLDKLAIKKPANWDRLWRMVVFDIPERNKQGRDALAQKLKQMGFIGIQKSVFVFPYECKNEVDFITEIFELRPYVRYLVVKEIDIDLDLKHRFEL